MGEAGGQQLRQRRNKGKKTKQSKSNAAEFSGSSVPPAGSSSSSTGYDGFAWLSVFVPALSYYVFLRHGSDYGPFSRSSVYPVIARSVVCGGSSCDGMASLFHTGTTAATADSVTTVSLRRPLERLLSNNDDDDDVVDRAASPQLFHHLNHPLWLHDEELGRGYLLLSDVIGNRIWRWEVGGGPITIGRTLHMERSGWRSSKEARRPDHPRARTGSAGLTVTATLRGSDSASPVGGAGTYDRLVVSEWGERRIVRIEEDGARTPLLKHVRAWDVVYVPTLRDLLFTSSYGDDHDDGDLFTVPTPTTLYVLRQIHRIPPLPADRSRAAHYDTQDVQVTKDVVYTTTNNKKGDGTILGVAVAPDYRSVYVLERKATKHHHNYDLRLVRVELEEPYDDDDDDDDDKAEHESAECGSTVFATLTPYLPTTILATADITAGGVQVDTEGTVYVAVDYVGILVVNPDGAHVGTVPVLDDRVTSLAFGEDGYLYVTTTTGLSRIGVRRRGMTMGVVGEGVGYDKVKRIRCGSSIL